MQACSDLADVTTSQVQPQLVQMVHTLQRLVQGSYLPTVVKFKPKSNALELCIGKAVKGLRCCRWNDSILEIVEPESFILSQCLKQRVHHHTRNTTFQVSYIVGRNADQDDTLQLIDSAKKCRQASSPWGPSIWMDRS